MPIEATPQGPFLGNIADLLAKVRKTAEVSQDSAVTGNQPEKYILLDVIMQALRPFEKVAERASYGEPLIQGGKETVAAGVDPDLAEGGSNFVPFGKIAAIAKSLGAAKGGLLAGLTPAGPRNLMMSHGTGIDDLIRRKAGGKLELIPELTSPSLMIQKDRVANGFASNERGVTLIPREGAFDPKTAPNVAVFNRDVYTARKEKYNPTLPENIFAEGDEYGQHVTRRLAERGLVPNQTTPPGLAPANPRGSRFKEYSDHTIQEMPLSRQVSMIASPDFRSLAQYERSPAGAATLASPGEPHAWGEKWERDLRPIKERYFPEEPPQNMSPEEIDDYFAGMGSDPDYGPKAADVTRVLREEAKGGGLLAQDLIKSAAQAPSEYGEVKAIGPVPWTNQHWAGAILDTGRDDPARTAALIREMHARGIPVVHTDTHLDSSGLGNSNLEIANWLQQQLVKHGELAKWPEGDRALLAKAAPAPTPFNQPALKDMLEQAPWGSPEPSMSKSLKATFASIENQQAAGNDLGTHTLPNIQAAMVQAMNNEGGHVTDNYKKVFHNGGSYKVFKDGTMHKMDMATGEYKFFDPNKGAAKTWGKEPHDWTPPASPEEVHNFDSHGVFGGTPEGVGEEALKAWNASLSKIKKVDDDAATFLHEGKKYTIFADGEIYTQGGKAQKVGQLYTK